MILTLVGDVLFGVPATLVRQVLGGLRDEIDRERLVTEDSIKARMQQLQLMVQDGELGQEAYEQMETQLIERLRLVREYQRGRQP